MLKAKLPEMYGELEKCSKALEGYLEQKRSKFPRFYFCSNSKLLQILSQGSDPTTMNAHYETVFDALEKVDHDKKDKAIIRSDLGVLTWWGAFTLSLGLASHTRRRGSFLFC